MAVNIAFIIIFGLAADYLFRRVRLPGLLGMLFVGVLAGPYVLDLMAPEMMAVSADFRKLALIVILLRAGLELHRDSLHRVGRPALIMSAVPAVFEIAAVVAAGRWLLSLSYLDSAILGTILAAVSPAVVVPLMIDFMDRGRGVRKGIPTLVLGASSVDDVFVIVIFSILLGMHKGGGDVHLLQEVLRIPISVILGVAAGLVPGYFLYRLFQKYDFRPPKRTMIVLGAAVFLTALEGALEGLVPLASLLGVMTIGFIILEKAEPIAHVISRNLKKLWVFAELLLFVLVGAQVNIHVAFQAGFAGVLVIGAGLAARSLGTYLSLAATELSIKEKLFCIVAYIPKATVQAAIGAVPLAAGVSSGEVILAVAVLSILITAPIGAVGIKLVGERVLDYGEKIPRRFRELRESLELPRVGERIRSKATGEVWKVIAEEETWQRPGGPPDETGIPVIQQRYWKEGEADRPGRGETRWVRFAADGGDFSSQWEILYDW